jgi:hypothetical protein
MAYQPDRNLGFLYNSGVLSLVDRFWSFTSLKDLFCAFLLPIASRRLKVAFESVLVQCRKANLVVRASASGAKASVTQNLLDSVALENPIFDP